MFGLFGKKEETVEELKDRYLTLVEEGNVAGANHVLMQLMNKTGVTFENTVNTQKGGTPAPVLEAQRKLVEFYENRPNLGKIIDYITHAARETGNTGSDFFPQYPQVKRMSEETGFVYGNGKVTDEQRRSIRKALWEYKKLLSELNLQTQKANMDRDEIITDLRCIDYFITLMEGTTFMMVDGPRVSELDMESYENHKKEVEAKKAQEKANKESQLDKAIKAVEDHDDDNKEFSILAADLIDDIIDNDDYNDMQKAVRILKTIEEKVDFGDFEKFCVHSMIKNGRVDELDEEYREFGVYGEEADNLAKIIDVIRAR